MTKIQISPSLLEEYRKVQAGLFDRTGDDLESQILGDFARTEAMSRGSAYHAILEHGAEPYAVGDSCKVHDPQMGIDWVFSKEAVAPALAVRKELDGRLLHEIWGNYETVVGGYLVSMRLRVDALQPDALLAHEFKTTGSQPSFLGYYDSLQWRCYLLAFPDLQAVKYTVFQLGTKNDWCRVSEYVMHRNEECETLVASALSGFLEWLSHRPAALQRLTDKANDRRV